MTTASRKKALIFLISFFFQLVFIYIYSSKIPISIGGDARIYDNIAGNLYSGKGLTENGTTPAPDHIKYGYIYFLALLYKVSARNLLFVKIVQALLVGFVCVLTYKIAGELFSEKVALRSALVTALHPALSIVSSHIISESLFTFLVALGILYLVKAVKARSLKAYLVSGIFIGAATQVRFISFFFPFFAAAGLYLFSDWKKTALFAGALMISAVVLMSLPWAVRNYVVLGHFDPFIGYGGGGAVWLGTYTKGNANQDNPQIKKIGHELTEELAQKYPKDGVNSPEMQLERQRVLFKMAAQNIKDDPAGYIRLFPIKIVRLWTGTYGGLFMCDITFPEFIKNRSLIREHFIMLSWKLYVFILSLVVFSLAVLGMIVSFKDVRRILPLYLIVFYINLFHMLLFANTRMGIPVLPYMIIFAVLGWDLIEGKISNALRHSHSHA